MNKKKSNYWVCANVLSALLDVSMCEFMLLSICHCVRKREREKRKYIETEIYR